MQEFFQSQVLPKIMWFVNTKAVRAIKDGMVYSMPLIIVGAVFLLLANLPYEPAADAVKAAGLTPYLNHGFTSSFELTALIASIAIAYTWAKNDGWEPLSAGIISCSVFLILIPDYVPTSFLDANGETLKVYTMNSDKVVETAQQVAGLSKSWLAGQGVIAAIIAGLITGLVYSKFLEADIRIKMPEGVPDGVAAAFTGLIPAAVMLLGAVIVYAICEIVAQVTPVELIYRFIQTPLQNLGDSLIGVAVIEMLIPFLWWFGVHGATVVGSVADPIAQANMQANQALYNQYISQGMKRPEAIAALGASGEAHIFTDSFKNCFQAITGSGITMGLVIYMTFFAKSQQFKQVGKLGFGSGIFNINEPILFGTPIVMNPKLFVPFVLAPLFGNVGAYILTSIGFIPYTTGVTVPWTTPPVLSGFICIGWQAALWQLIEIAASFFIYLPFARSVDNDAYEMEQAA